jgi:hypothetical protein
VRACAPCGIEQGCIVRKSLLSLVAVATLAVSPAVLAQSRADDPARPAAAAPPLRYLSAFEGYRPFDDAGPGNWRQVNDRVRDAAAKAPAAPAGPAQPAPGQAAPPQPMPAGVTR